MKYLIAVIIIVLAGWGIYALVHKGATTNTSNTTGQTNTSTTGSTDQSNSALANPTNDQSGVTQTPVLASTTDAKLGNIITASSGMTLYKYTKDTPGVSNCTGTCAVTWPPYTVTSAAGLVAATGLTGNLGTITRADGTLQVTYNNTPLYFYNKDTKPGDTNGQNVGGVWFVVAP